MEFQETNNPLLKANLRQWMLHHLEKRSFPGVERLDNQGLFKIPWCNYGEHNWKDYFKIFLVSYIL